MKKSKRTASEEKWLKALGLRIQQLIESKGYASPYEFWIEKGEDQFSRTTLNYILTGRTDPRITTLKTISKLLGVSLNELLKVVD